MWYHSLKTRQSVKRINARNSGGVAVALEYVDKKIEVHHLTREASPMIFDEGTGVIFVAPRDGCLVMVAVNISSKGKFTYEFRVWELTSGTAFVQRDITVKDTQGSFTNDGKSKALLTLPEVSQHSNQLRMDGLQDLMAIALGVSVIYMYKCAKIDNASINCEVVMQVNSSMSALDVLLLKPQKENFPQLLVCESGGIRVWQETTEIRESEEVASFKDTFYSVQPFDAGTSLVTCQDFQRIHNGACIFANNIGNLYLFSSSRVVNLRLPVSHGGHGLFAVENVDEKCSKVTLAVVSKGHTVNLYQLEDIHSLSDSCEDLVLVPHHALFSTQSLGAMSFLNKASLIACSSSGRTLSMWVGV
ncbi:uncharacterized protein LOC114528576 [Dendronephthya gigantea]|uniref:uncharacterized protein LOC114528576 n=1 Tax=Dendronephthya gigantea TaxID=151771 RepID=UPI0010693B5B|nr:uncharacterized protein LOC114528576 [Dendronephthya gigantea]XP_028406043.1 uncharacterized protein LOC114528576 [Dendronephthya gigantea]